MSSMIYLLGETPSIRAAIWWGRFSLINNWLKTRAKKNISIITPEVVAVSTSPIYNSKLLGNFICLLYSLAAFLGAAIQKAIQAKPKQAIERTKALM